VSRARALAIALGALVSCASPGADTSRVTECGPLGTLAPLPEACAPGELDEFSSALWGAMRDRAHSSLVRVELDDAARVRAVCVEDGPGYGPGSARRALAEHLDAILALPPGPACAAGRRLDLNRYEAAFAELRDREDRCGEQTRITRETHGETQVRDRAAGGAYGVYAREYEDCLDHHANWIALDAPGSTRPWIYVKPEVPDPAAARETASRCFRESRVFEKRAACIESDGWERLEPPPR
jgi:hypothetical protein